MSDQRPLDAEQLKIPEKPQTPVPEVKAKEKPMGQVEQGMVNFIKKDGGVHIDGNPQTGNPDSILQGLATANTQGTEAAQKTPYEQFMENSGDKTKIVGGEIISPTAVRVPNQEKGETVDQVRKEAEAGGWLSAITNAKDRPSDIQEIVNATKAAGVPKEALKTHLESLGINVTQAENANPTNEQIQHQEINLENLTQQDFVDLAQRFNKARLELAQTNKEAFDKLGNLPVGALISATTNGGNEKSKAAYAQIAHALNEVGTGVKPSVVGKPESATPAQEQPTKPAAEAPSTQPQNTEKAQVDLDNLAPKDYADLVTKFNQVRDRLAEQKDYEKFATMGQMPIAAVMEGAWSEPSKKTKAAYDQLKQTLDHVEGIAQPAAKETLGATQETPTEPAKVTTEKATPIDEMRINGYLGEIAAQARLVQKGVLKPEEVQRMVDEAKVAGVPTDQIEITLRGVGVGIKKENKPAAAAQAIQQPENQPKQPTTESQANNSQGKTEQEQDYKNLENVRKAREKLLLYLKMPDANWDQNDKNAIQHVLYEMLTTRSNYDKLLDKYGGLQGLRNSAEYQQYKAMAGKLQELGKQYQGQLNVDYNPAWLGINTRADVPRREGINIKSYVTLPPEQIDFVQRLPELALVLRDLATESDDIIQVKIPTSYEVLVKNNDNIVVHYKKAENAQRVNELMGQWMQRNQITEAPREMDRTKVAADPKGTSFTDSVASHITDWIQQNYGKYPTEVLADEAIKHAISVSQKPPQTKSN